MEYNLLLHLMDLSDSAMCCYNHWQLVYSTIYLKYYKPVQSAVVVPGFCKYEGQYMFSEMHLQKENVRLLKKTHYTRLHAHFKQKL